MYIMLNNNSLQKIARTAIGICTADLIAWFFIALNKNLHLWFLKRLNQCQYVDIVPAL